MNEQELIREVFGRLLKGHFLPVHSCSMCEYQCGYRAIGGVLMYDSGCPCYPSGKSPRQLIELVDYVIENIDYVRQWVNCTLINKKELSQWLH